MLLSECFCNAVTLSLCGQASKAHCCCISNNTFQIYLSALSPGGSQKRNFIKLIVVSCISNNTLQIYLSTSSPGRSHKRNVITFIRSYEGTKIRLVVSRKRREITTRVLVLRNTRRVKCLRKRMNKRRGQVSGRGVVQESCWITLNRPDLEFKLAQVLYLCRWCHDADSMWDVFSTARA